MLVKTRHGSGTSHEPPPRGVRCFVWLLAGAGSIVLGVLALCIPPTSVEGRQLFAIGILGAYGVIFLGIGLLTVGIRQWIATSHGTTSHPDS
jgi:hypothetical protein